MPWLTLPPRQRRGISVTAPDLLHKQHDSPADVARLLALAEAQTPALHRAILEALTWDALPDDVRQALLAGNASLATTLLTAHVEARLGAVYAPAFSQVAAALFTQVATQQWDTVRDVFRALAVPSPIPTAVPGDLITPRAIEALQRDGLRRVQGITTTTMEALRSPLMEGVAQGIPTPRIARELVPKIGLTTQQARALETYAEGVAELPQATREARIERKAMQLRRKRARTIARTETQAALNTAADTFYEQASAAVGLAPGALKRYWLTASGPRLCERCAPIPGLNPDGRTFGEPFATPEGPYARPPLHPNCVSGDTLVTPGGTITAVSKRWYEGEMLVLHTALKKQLACTPNHPILTRHGWVAAGLLKPGSEILCGSGHEGIMLVNNHIGHMPAPIEQIVETYRLASGVASRKVPVTPEDFHGDGEGSKIAIIGTDGLLWDDGKETLNKPLLEELFERRPLPDALVDLRNFHAGLQGDGFPSHHQMCGRRLPLALLRRHLAPLQAFGLALRPQRHAMFAQTCGNDGTLCPKRVRQRIDRHAVKVQRDDLFFWQWHAALEYTLRTIASYRDASLTQPIINDLGTDAIFPSHLRSRDTRLVTSDQLVNIESMPFRGHVYNLQTEQGWYIGNGIMTHNCRCVIIVRPAVLSV